MSQLLPGRTRTDLDGIGTLNQPTSGYVDCTVVKDNGTYRLDFVLKSVRVPVTDGGVSGSYGSLKLLDLVEGAWSFLGARQNYTAYSSDGTGVPNNAAFEIGVGTAAIAVAADGTLGNGVNENIGQAVTQTLSGGTTTGTAVDGAKTTAIDGTGTATDINLNVSGTAATVTANGWLDVTGTISVRLAPLGDD